MIIVQLGRTAQRRSSAYYFQMLLVIRIPVTDVLCDGNAMPQVLLNGVDSILYETCCDLLWHLQQPGQVVRISGIPKKSTSIFVKSSILIFLQPIERRSFIGRLEM